MVFGSFAFPSSPLPVCLTRWRQSRKADRLCDGGGAYFLGGDRQTDGSWLVGIHSVYGVCLDVNTPPISPKALRLKSGRHRDIVCGWSVVRYRVVPLSPDTGVIEWVEDTITLASYLISGGGRGLRANQKQRNGPPPQSLEPISNTVDHRSSPQN